MESRPVGVRTGRTGEKRLGHRSGGPSLHMDPIQKGTAQQRRFATDYQPEASKDYLEIFQADGWQLEWTGANGWYLFSKAYTDVRPEIFTDNASLIEKNNRILKVLLPLFIMLIVLFITIVLPVLKEPFYVGLYVFALGLYTYIFTQVWRHNRKLKIDI